MNNVIDGYCRFRTVNCRSRYGSVCNSQRRKTFSINCVIYRINVAGMGSFGFVGSNDIIPIAVLRCLSSVTDVINS